MSDHLIGKLQQLGAMLTPRNAQYAAAVQAAAFIIEYFEKNGASNMGLIAKELEALTAQVQTLKDKLAAQATDFATQQQATAKEIADLTGQVQEANAAKDDANTKAAGLQTAVDAANATIADLQKQLAAGAAPVPEDAADVQAIKDEQAALGLDDAGNAVTPPPTPAPTPEPAPVVTPPTPDAPQAQG